MRKPNLRTFLTLGCALGLGCATHTYSYNFDLTDPGARNQSRPGERDTLEDGDVRTELLVDPTSFQAVALDITNKTDSMLSVDWNNILMVLPNQDKMTLRPDTSLSAVPPGAKVMARLAPFTLPTTGSAAEQLDNATFELIIPMVVRNTPKEYHYHLKAKLQKL